MEIDFIQPKKTVGKLISVDVLDKSRAEIAALNPVDYVFMSSYEGHRGASDMKDDVLQIIDKYRGE